MFNSVTFSLPRCKVIHLIVNLLLLTASNQCQNAEVCTLLTPSLIGNRFLYGSRTNFSSEALWRRSKDSYKSLTSCPCDWTIFTIAFKTTLLPLSCSLVVDIWSAAVAKGVWKDTADCGERQVGVRYAGAWGSQVLWSVRLCPPSWWSKTGITAADDRGCRPDRMHNADYDVSRDEPYQSNGSSKNVITAGTATTHRISHRNKTWIMPHQLSMKFFVCFY